MGISVSLRECRSYSSRAVNKAVRKSIGDLGGIRRFVRKGERVLLKANLLSDKVPEKAVTTHPSVVSAVADLVREAGALPVIGDNPFPLSRAKSIFRKTGMQELCRQKKVLFTALGAPRRFSNPKGRLVKSFSLSSRLDEFDCIINIPKLKTHSFMVYTGAVKNYFGLIPGKAKPLFHLRFQQAAHFSQMLLDLYALVEPFQRLVVMDAVLGMEGEGPSSGTPKEIGCIISSADSIAADTAASEIVGITGKVPYLSMARSQGLKGSGPGEITLKGDNISLFRIRDFRLPSGALPRQGLMRFLGDRLVQFPEVSLDRCTGCARCSDICPVVAISMVKYRKYSTKKPKFYYGKCIKCYCCHEFCPERAIRLKDSLLSRALGRLVR